MYDYDDFGIISACNIAVCVVKTKTLFLLEMWQWHFVITEICWTKTMMFFNIICTWSWPSIYLSQWHNNKWRRLFWLFHIVFISVPRFRVFAVFAQLAEAGVELNMNEYMTCICLHGICKPTLNISTCWPWPTPAESKSLQDRLTNVHVETAIFIRHFYNTCIKYSTIILYRYTTVLHHACLSSSISHDSWNITLVLTADHDYIFLKFTIFTIRFSPTLLVQSSYSLITVCGFPDLDSILKCALRSHSQGTKSYIHILVVVVYNVQVCVIILDKMHVVSTPRS